MGLMYGPFAYAKARRADRRLVRAAA